LARGERNGDRRPACHQHVPGSLQRKIRGQNLCPSRFPEEIEEGHRDTAEGYRADPAADRRRATPQGKGRTETKKPKKIRAKEGSGNVFTNLDLPQAELELLRTRLTLEI